MKKALTAIATAVAVLVGMTACAPSATQASDSGSGSTITLSVDCYAGTYVDMFKKDVFPAFEKKYGVKFDYTPGTSTETISKLQAAGSKQTADLACVDTGPKSTANSLGLLAKNDTSVMTNLSHVESYAKDPDGIGVIWGTLALGIAYDKKALTKADIAPPTSWNDLASARFKKQVVMSSINTTYGELSLLQWATANGGSADDIAPGFAKAVQVKKNAVAVSAKADLSDYFEQGEASIGIWTDAETKGFASTSGYDMGFVYPTDGAPIIGATMSAVKGAPHAKLAQEFLNYLMSPAVQRTIVEKAGFRPTIDDADLTAAEKTSIGFDDAAHLVQPDYSAIETHRAAWTNEWMKEIG